jgi:hypothetical protein
MACLSYPRGIIAGVSDAGSEANGSVEYPDVRQYLAELLAAPGSTSSGAAGRTAPPTTRERAVTAALAAALR